MTTDPIRILAESPEWDKRCPDPRAHIYENMPADVCRGIRKRDCPTCRGEILRKSRLVLYYEDQVMDRERELAKLREKHRATVAYAKWLEKHGDDSDKGAVDKFLTFLEEVGTRPPALEADDAE